ncbi:MAG: Lrp/AsnC family transcriptional regulator [Methylomicrobium sp.]
MIIDERDRQLLAAVQAGLPICSRPYAEIGRRIAMPEFEVIERLTYLKRAGLIKRLGVIVKHRALGYRANAMVVWNIADSCVEELGQKMSRFDFVTLCYQRPRRLPDWPYNLFCMIHGKDRSTVLAQIESLAQDLELFEIDRAVLFSQRCFKQRGARYRITEPTESETPVYG